jgi:AcrR family transcriptional regulator
MAKKRNTKPLPEPSKSELRTGLLLGRLLDAAAIVFMEKGFDATSMGEIAKLAHASTETFYRHFPTKEDLFRRVLLRRAESFTAQLSSVLLSQGPPKKALAAFGELVLSMLLEPQVIALHRIMTMERGRFPELINSFHAQGPVRVQASLAEYLDEQIKLKRLRKMNSYVAARQFLDLVIPEFLFGVDLRSNRPPTKPQIRQRVQEAIDCFLHGYGPEHSHRTKQR